MLFFIYERRNGKGRVFLFKQIFEICKIVFLCIYVEWVIRRFKFYKMLVGIFLLNMKNLLLVML